MGTKGGALDKRDKSDSRQPPIGHTSLVQTGKKPAFLAVQSDVLFFIRMRNPSAVNKFDPQDIELFVLDVVFPFFSVSFRQREAAGFIGKKSWLLVPEQTAIVLRESGPVTSYRL